MTKVEVMVGADGHMIIEAKGHTQDIVCAAVSTLMQSQVRFLQDLSEQYPDKLQVNINYEEPAKP